MKNQKKRTVSKSMPRARANDGTDAIAVLEKQQREVEALIAWFEKARTNEDARALGDDI